jgi:P-type E1-E2 ATPase
VIRTLRRAGIKRIVMVTGDHPDVAESVGIALGVDRVLSERDPSDKVAAVEAERAEGGVTIMVGDGINDAPALAAADVGVAMGARGATASSEAADVVLIVDRLDRVADAMTIARRSRSIALQSVLVGMGLSFGAMLFGAFGLLLPVAGALVQEAIDVAVILNALRALGD